jgi:phospholipid-transporting ATPase
MQMPFDREIMFHNLQSSISLTVVEWLKNILTFIVLFNNLIPLSLVITLEVVRLGLAYLIDMDLDMYYAPNDTPASTKTSSLVEELGQIDYIFSDKTGTLTCNIMEFKKISIGGFSYSEILSEDELRKPADHGTCLDLRTAKEGPKAALINEILMLISVCHSVIPEICEDNTVKYQSASPDESALVDGVRQFGFEFVVP